MMKIKSIIQKAIFPCLCILLSSNAYSQNTSEFNGDKTDLNQQKTDEDQNRIVLLDSIYDAPMLITHIYENNYVELANDNKLIIYAFEQKNLYTKEKEYCLNFEAKFDSWRPNASISVSVKYEDAILIYKALQKMNEYYRESIPIISETVCYQKNLNDNTRFDVNIYYNSKKDKWRGEIEFVARSSRLINNNLSHKDGGFGIHGEFNDVNKDLPKLIQLFERGLSALESRINLDGERKYQMKINENGDRVYFEKDIPLDESFNMELSAEYAMDLDKYKYQKKLNQRLANIIGKEYNEPGKYGIIDLVIGKYGNVINAQLLIRNDVASQLTEKTIELMLDELYHYYFLPIKYKGETQMRLYMPLTIGKNKKEVRRPLLGGDGGT